MSVEPEPSRPIGKRFSHVYLQGGDLLQDSKRARRRVAALFSANKDLDGFSSYLTAEVGIDVRFGASGVNWPLTIDGMAPRDFFDTITVAYKYLTIKKKGSMYISTANQLLVQSCSRIFAEENLCYEIDAAGGVHFKVDGEFAATNNATIAALNLPRYANAKAQFDQALAALAPESIDGKQAVRGVFNSVECVYKLMYQRAPKLTAAESIKSLQTVVQNLYDQDSTAQRAANKAVNAFGDWVDACHNYRHEDGVEEPSQPPLELALLLISQGSSFLRWLINLDQRTSAPKTDKA